MQARVVTRRSLMVNASCGQPNKPAPPPRASKRVSMLGLAAAWEAFADTTLPLQPSLKLDRSIATSDIPDGTVDLPGSAVDDSTGSLPDSTVLGAVESRSGGGGHTGGRRR